MSMTEAIGRIQSIESMLQQLSQGVRPQTATTGTTDSSAGTASSPDAASFAQALSSAVGGSTALPPSPPSPALRARGRFRVPALALSRAMP